MEDRIEKWNRIHNPCKIKKLFRRKVHVQSPTLCYRARNTSYHSYRQCIFENGLPFSPPTVLLPALIPKTLRGWQGLLQR